MGFSRASSGACASAWRCTWPNIAAFASTTWRLPLSVFTIIVARALVFSLPPVPCRSTVCSLLPAVDGVGARVWASKALPG